VLLHSIPFLAPCHGVCMITPGQVVGFVGRPEDVAQAVRQLLGHASSGVAGWPTQSDTVFKLSTQLGEGAGTSRGVGHTTESERPGCAPTYPVEWCPSVDRTSAGHWRNTSTQQRRSCRETATIAHEAQRLEEIARDTEGSQLHASQESITSRGVGEQSSCLEPEGIASLSATWHATNDASWTPSDAQVVSPEGRIEAEVSHSIAQGCSWPSTCQATDRRNALPSRGRAAARAGRKDHRHATRDGRLVADQDDQVRHIAEAASGQGCASLAWNCNAPSSCCPREGQKSVGEVTERQSQPNTEQTKGGLEVGVGAEERGHGEPTEEVGGGLARSSGTSCQWFSLEEGESEGSASALDGTRSAAEDAEHAPSGSSAKAIGGPRKGQEGLQRAKTSTHTTTKVDVAGTAKCRIAATSLRNCRQPAMHGLWVGGAPKSELPSKEVALCPLSSGGPPCGSVLENNYKGRRSPRGSNRSRECDELIAQSSSCPSAFDFGSVPRPINREDSPPPGPKSHGGVVATPPRQQFGASKAEEGFFGSPRPPDTSSGKELVQQDCPAEGQALQQQMPQGVNVGKAPFDPIHYLTTIMEVCHNCPCWVSALPILLDGVLEKVKEGDGGRHGTTSVLYKAVQKCISVTKSPVCTSAAVIAGLQCIQRATNGEELSEGNLATLEAALCGS